jgi:hypothetical protein
MESIPSSRWIRTALLFSIVYPIVGITFSQPANAAASNEVRVAWRLAAWLVSAATFAAHLWYEHFRARSSAPRAAFHVSVAVAVGAFILAIWINAHAYWTASSHPRSHALALVVFPVVTGVPAFVVALLAAFILARIRR